MEITILGIIPARGGSKRVPKKNTKLLGKKPLIAYTIDAATKSRFLTDCVVSTDAEYISEIVKKYGVRTIERPKELATDKAKTTDVLLHAVRHVECDIVVCLQPTSPLRTARDIDNAIGLFLENDCDSVISCSVNGPNGAVYVSTPENLLKNKTFYAGMVLVYTMPPERSLDIDEPGDFNKAKKALCVHSS